MSSAHAKPMTSAEFLAWEEQQELKWEFDGTRPVAMNGGTFAHSYVQGNIILVLRPKLRRSACEVCGPDVRVPTGQGRYRYPDAVVTCSPIILGMLEIVNPVVIFEVLSTSTSANDRTTKLSEYLLLPSLRHYVMLEQDRAFATVLTRTDTGWQLTPAGPEATIAMPEIGAELPLAELYDGLTFPPTE